MPSSFSLQSIIDFFRNLFGIKSATAQTTNQISQQPRTVPVIMRTTISPKVAQPVASLQKSGVAQTIQTISQFKAPSQIITHKVIGISETVPVPKEYQKGGSLYTPPLKSIYIPYVPPALPKGTYYGVSPNAPPHPVASLEKSGVEKTIQTLSQISIVPNVPLSQVLSQGRTSIAVKTPPTKRPPRIH
jgi:hypothetical protein